ncbi:Carboxy-terminal domain (CTD) phosphatase [Dinochytrium kinnereticum]|nr:Carboxy-terminal domain (CTD) phosphatase [Dinochytrium kinnereticum]
MEVRHDLGIVQAHLPATIVELKARPKDGIAKGQELLIYEYLSLYRYRVRNRDNPEISTERTVPKRVKGALVSNFAGFIDTIKVAVGDTVKTTAPIVGVIEPCDHSVQARGLCALCGKDLTIADFMGSDVSRAPISMTHDSLGVTVSLQEATRVERDNAERLLSEQRLSLILDLDQTVIHATVDPTVGEWMKDKDNPNNTALKSLTRGQDVHDFRLPDSPVIYYIKLRPGTREFLERMHAIYELHIYTMGTKNYAKEVAHILDPDGKYFQDRILSRDDSGSFHIKRIQRLFPCDQSMVVVVDDRGDVWQWPQNLVQVRPYDFFIGIGDINEPLKAPGKIPSSTPSSASIEKVPEINGVELAPPPIAGLDSEVKATALNIENGLDENYASEVRSEEDMVSKIMEEMTSVQQVALEQQVQERPLAHRQEEQAEIEEVRVQTTIVSRVLVVEAGSGSDSSAHVSHSEIHSSTSSSIDILNGKDFTVSDSIDPSKIVDHALSISSTLPQKPTPDVSTNSTSTIFSTPPTSPPDPTTPWQASVESTEVKSTKTLIAQRRRPVLVDSDAELTYVERVLSDVHARFYEALERQNASPGGAGRGEEADVRVLMKGMREGILEGVKIVFSGVIPKEMDVRRHEAWRTATSLGAVCVDSINREVTHVVAAKAGTAKVNKAKQYRNIHIVSPQWLFHTAFRWERMNEQDYILEREPESGRDDFPFTFSSPSSTESSFQRNADSPHLTTDAMILVGDEKEADEKDEDDLDEAADDIFETLGQDDWGLMMDEINEAMTDEEDEEDDEEDGEGKKQEEESPAKRVPPAQQGSFVEEGEEKNEAIDDEFGVDWDALLDEELDGEGGEASGPPPPPPTISNKRSYDEIESFDASDSSSVSRPRTE